MLIAVICACCVSMVYPAQASWFSVVKIFMFWLDCSPTAASQELGVLVCD